MSAGTLTLTNNSDLVSGAGTSFSTELTAGDFVVATVGGVTYTLPVKSVEGDTEITLISKYPGPTQEGSAWNVVPRATQNQVTAALVVQSTEALRGLNYDKQNWQAVFSADGNITVFLPDGTSFSGPSWKSIAETLSTLDVDHLNQLAAQINHDAQQVETDKNTVVDTAQQISTDAQTASTAAIGAQGSAADAAESETNAEGFKELARKYALNPEDSPVTGNEYSSFHYSEKSRKSAEEAASHNPVEALVKSLNLSDLADRAAAWLNLRPLGSTPLAGDPVNPYDATTMRWVENYVSGGGGTGPTMNGVQNFGVGQPALWTSRAFIPDWSVVADGQILNRADWPELWAHAQMHTPIDDADWLADKFKRAAYSTGDGSTTFRVPDLNGVQNGSLVGLYGRGDAGGGYATQTVLENGAPNITGSTATSSITGYNQSSPARGTGLVVPKEVTASSLKWGLAGSAGPTVTYFSEISFDASRSNAAYGRASDVRPNTFVGVWIIRASGGFVAANTSWSVNNEDAEMPPSGAWANGGIIRSAYRVSGVDVSASAMYSSFAIDSGGYRNAKLNFSVDNKNGANYTLSISEKGVISSSNNEFNFDSLIRSSHNVVAGAGRAFVIAATERNEVRLTGTPTAPTTGNFVNSMLGYWYNGYYQFGGIRSASTALQRVQLNVNDGSGNIASYMFNPNGVAQAAQWQSTSDRRVKSCIETIPDPLAVMRSMRGYSWYYEPYGTQGFGFMADEAEKHFPGAVKTTEDFEVEMPDGSKIRDVKSVDTYGIAAALHHEAILVMMDQIAELKAEIKKLKGE
ncbi:TPA: tail fiber domain-containing protein [Citrobacter amalonaticus]|nr:tail fiber domain-containing protein [Citrobacter amalonaticus]